MPYFCLDMIDYIANKLCNILSTKTAFQFSESQKVYF